MKRILVTILVIAILQTSFCAFAQHTPEFKRNGDEVIIEGNAAQINESVTMKVYNEAGKLIYIRQTRSDNMKKFSFNFTPNITKTENLTIKVKCASSETIEEITAPYEVASDIVPPATDDNEGNNLPPGGGNVSSGGNSSISSSKNKGSGGGGGGGISIPNKQEKPKEEQKEEKTSLKDIENHWGEEDINYLYEKGIVAGDTEGNYNPDAKIKRSEFLALTVRTLGLEMIPYEGGFSDVDNDAWYSQIVQSALSAEIISADTVFRPDAEITRQEMAKIAASVLQLTEKDNSETEFSDSKDISDWAKPYVEKAVMAGLIKGDDKGCFNPLSGATKAESAAVIKRLYDRGHGNEK